MVRKSKRILAFITSIDKAENSLNIDSLNKLIEKYKAHAAKFNESVDVAFGMNIDPKKADQITRGTCVLPHGNGKKYKVVVFASGSDVDTALKKGAAYAGGEELIEEIAKGNIVAGKDFDKVIAVPALMTKLPKISKILGPKGLMPNPKVGTVTSNVSALLDEIFSGRIDFKSDKNGYIKLCIGKLSFSADQIKDNLMAVYNGIKNVRPASIKANFFNEARVSVTMMGYSFKLKMTEFYNA